MCSHYQYANKYNRGTNTAAVFHTNSVLPSRPLEHLVRCPIGKQRHKQIKETTMKTQEYADCRQ